MKVQTMVTLCEAVANLTDPRLESDELFSDRIRGLRAAEEAYVAERVGRIPPLPGDVSDGYHTFDDLYEHRIVLFLVVCKLLDHGRKHPPVVWRSRLHSDGAEPFGGGWFIMGIGRTAGEQITYHLPESRWKEAGFAETLDRAPPFDGHTPEDVIDRLRAVYARGAG